MLVTDVETTFILQNKKSNPSPYIPENYLVSVGLVGDAEEYLCVQHNDQPTDRGWFKTVQEALDNTELVVGHNLKFDLAWMFEVGLVYTGPIWDTMLVEYILLRGIKQPLSLTPCCERHGIEGKLDITQEYLNKGIGFEAMPWETVVKPYGIRDCVATKQLCLAQKAILNV